MANKVSPIQVQKYLKGIDYPASKADILVTARSEGADDQVIDTLGLIPDREYDGPNAVSHEIGQAQDGAGAGSGTVNPIQLQRYLKGLDYPAGKAEILSKARSEGADRPALDTLERIADHEYDGPTAISHEVGRTS